MAEPASKSAAVNTQTPPRLQYKLSDFYTLLLHHIDELVTTYHNIRALGATSDIPQHVFRYIDLYGTITF